MPEENNELMRAVGRIEGSLDIGFKTINEHLRVLNGSVARNVSRIEAMDKEQGIMKLKVGMIIAGVSAVVSIAVTLIVNYITKL